MQFIFQCAKISVDLNYNLNPYRNVNSIKTCICSSSVLGRFSYEATSIGLEKIFTDVKNVLLFLGSPSHDYFEHQTSKWSSHLKEKSYLPHPYQLRQRLLLTGSVVINRYGYKYHNYDFIAGRCQLTFLSLYAVTSQPLELWSGWKSTHLINTSIPTPAPEGSQYLTATLKLIHVTKMKFHVPQDMAGPVLEAPVLLSVLSGPFSPLSLFHPN